MTMLPAEVEQIEIRPVWMLSDDEERRTKQVEVRFRSATVPAERRRSRRARPRLVGTNRTRRRAGRGRPSIEYEDRRAEADLAITG